MKKIIAAVVVIALATGFFGYTKSGTHLLNEMRFAVAWQQRQLLGAKKLLAAVIVAALIVGFLGYTKTGTRVMASLGLTTACSTDNC